MAVIKFGTIVTDIKGSLGGHVFKGSGAGAVIQTKRRKWGNSGILNPNGREANRTLQNPNGLNVQQAVAAIAGIWATLNAAHRATWQAASINFPHLNKFGAKNKPSGYHCFMAVNMRLLNAGGTIISEPPAFVSATTSPLFTIATLTFSAVIIDFAAAAPAGFTTIIKATSSLSPGIAPASNRFSTIVWNPSVGSGALNVSVAYKAAFGPPIVGNQISIWVQFINLTNGAASIPYVQSQVVA